MTIFQIIIEEGTKLVIPNSVVLQKYDSIASRQTGYFP